MYCVLVRTRTCRQDLVASIGDGGRRPMKASRVLHSTRCEVGTYVHVRTSGCSLSSVHTSTGRLDYYSTRYYVPGTRYYYVQYFVQVGGSIWAESSLHSFTYYVRVRGASYVLPLTSMGRGGNSRASSVQARTCVHTSRSLWCAFF